MTSNLEKGGIAVGLALVAGAIWFVYKKILAPVGSTIAELTGSTPTGVTGAESVAPTETHLLAQKPRNLIGAVGRIVSPLDGGEINIPALSGTYPMTVQLGNVGRAPIVGDLKLFLEEEVLFKNLFQTLGEANVGLQPGELREISFRARTAGLIGIGSVPVHARLEWAGYQMHSIDFSWT